MKIASRSSLEWVVHKAMGILQQTLKWLLLAVLGFVSLGFAQDNPTDWQVPENLSSSGSATNPKVVVDNTGIVHLVWLDNAGQSFVYARGGPDNWSNAESVELPFGTRQFSPDLRETDPTPLYIPAMVADKQGFIHAFWQDEEGALFYSRVDATQFNQFSAWLLPQRLAAAASGFSAIVDEDSALHLSYIRTQPNETFQTGVYYQKLASINDSWTNPLLLYQSSYYQQLPMDQANTHLAVRTAGDDSYVYLVWDNRSIEKLFFTRSVDDGLSWEEPTVIDERRPEDGPVNSGPADIMVTVDNDSVVLTWQAGHGFDLCTLYYQVSSDNGETWQASASMLANSFGCPERFLYVGSTGDFSLYLFFSQNRSYLLAWRGGQWSDPQLQQDLSSFISPQTFRPIDLDCHELAITDQDQLLAFGCGSGQNEQTQDIWHLHRSTGDIETWFPPAPIWQEPEVVIAGDLNLLSPKMAADSQGRIHTVWSQAAGTNNSLTEIFYAYWEDGQWSPSVPVLTSPESSIVQLELVVSNNDQLKTIWLTSSGKLFFSENGRDAALLKSDWSVPLELPSPGLFIAGADIAVTDDNSIYIAYSVPINEDRGVYLLESTDGGRSWSEPIIAIDGAANDWQIVGTPRLEVTNNGQFHLLIPEQASLAVGDGMASAALFYSRSESLDGAFDQPQLVSETPVVWADLIKGGQQLIHRLWQEQSGAITNTRHQYTVDGGQSWSEPLRVMDHQGPIDVKVDNSGRLHAIQIDSEALNHRLWNGQQWQLEDGLEMAEFEELSVVDPQSLSVALGPNQILAAIFTGPELAVDLPESPSNAYFTWRTIDELPTISLPTPAPTTTSSTSDASSATPEAEATATLVTGTEIVNLGDTTGGGSGPLGFLNTDNETIRLVIGIVPVALFLVIIIGVGLWIVRRTSR